MKKRKIFDIEKIGFGDEELKPIKKVSLPEPIVPVQPRVKVAVKLVIDRPQEVLNPEVNVKKEVVTASVKSHSNKQKNSSKISSPIYKPVEFVSPISGRRIEKPKTVHLAHGQYHVSSSIRVDDQMVDMLEDVIEQDLLAGDVCDINNEELQKMVGSEGDIAICPSSSTQENISELEVDEGAINSELSYEEVETLTISQSQNHLELCENDEVIEGKETSLPITELEDSQHLQSLGTATEAEISTNEEAVEVEAEEQVTEAETSANEDSTNEEAVEVEAEELVTEVETSANEDSTNEEAVEVEAEELVTEVETSANEDSTNEEAVEVEAEEQVTEAETSTNEDSTNEEAVEVEAEEQVTEAETSANEDSTNEEAVEVEAEEQVTEAETSANEDSTNEEAVEVEAEEQVTEAETSANEDLKIDETIIVQEARKVVQEDTPIVDEMTDHTNGLGIEDVLALLDEEEQSSIFDRLLVEEEAAESVSEEIAVDEVLNLLESEEKTPSIFEQVIHDYTSEQPVESADSLEEETLLNDELDDFDDENFCNEVLAQVQIEEEELESTYRELPSVELLNEPNETFVIDEEWIMNKMAILEQTFIDFGVKVKLTGGYTQGPTVTQIEIQPESGTKLNKIIGLSDDLKLSLSVEELRIEPIPGKNTIGVEIPNPKRKMVCLKEILSNSEFVLHPSPLCIGLGQDVAGKPVYADILTMPHGLIAGQTGSGKSVCINTLLISILYKASPEDVRVMLVDPKRVELAPYNAIPHLVTPVIVDERKAAMGLKWAVEEMERRYELFASNGVRDIKSFNDRRHEFEISYAKLPYILIIIDELADLMMVSAQEVEECIMRITQKARAAGIHLIVATQRPTVDVITGTIKSNIPSRIAFAVAQANDSRVILDENGAQSLLGQGDMLWSASGSKLKRVQGAYISSEEIDSVVDFVKQQGKPRYLIEEEVFQKGNTSIQTDTDPLINDAMNFIFDRGYATASSLQTRMRIGFNRAARIIDTLELNGWISEPQGSMKQREILISREEFEAMKDDTRF